MFKELFVLSLAFIAIYAYPADPIEAQGVPVGAAIIPDAPTDDMDTAEAHWGGYGGHRGGWGGGYGGYGGGYGHGGGWGRGGGWGHRGGYGHGGGWRHG